MADDIFTTIMTALTAASISYSIVMVFELRSLKKRFRSNRLSVSRYKELSETWDLGCKLLLVIWIVFLLLGFFLV